MKKKDEILMAQRAASASFSIAYAKGVDDAIVVFKKYFGNDWNGVDALRDLNKLKEQNENRK